MKNITLIKPVVLRSALNDMTVSQREIAVDFLTNRKFLLPDATGASVVLVMFEKGLRDTLLGEDAFLDAFFACPTP